MIAKRPKAHLGTNDLFSENQHSFREGHSTIQSREKVKSIAAQEFEKKTRGFCALVAIDVQNAFQTVP